MKTLGIDYGKRRIGMAVTDELGITVRPLPTLDRKRTDPLTAIRDTIAQEHPDTIVFGLPLDHNDEETAMAREVRSFAEKVIREIGLPVEFVDESGSSQRAEFLLRGRRKKVRRTKANVDKIAACLILEQFIEENGQS